MLKNLPMKNRESTYIVISVIILLVMACGAYWYFLMGPAPAAQPDTTGTQSGFAPFGRTDGKGTTSQGGTNGGTSASTTSSSNQATQTGPMPTLRLLSTTPVGGYGASTTARTTVIRWIDRGRGNVYEASYDSATVTTLSNTVVPRVYESSWNRNLTAFISSIFSDGDTTWSGVYSQLTPRATSTTDASQFTPFALRGKKLPATLIGYAVSPKKDKLVMLTNENGTGIGYVSNLDGTAVTKIFSTPLTQINIAWPSDNIIAITTKGSANYSGFLYFVNPKTGVWSKILGPILGLSTSVSHDGKYVLWSGAGNNSDIVTGLYSVAKNTNTDAGIATLADKCAWGNSFTTVVYCAVPSTLASGMYPDDWYRGIVSMVDKIWQVDATSGAVRLVSSLIDHADRVIDGYKLGLDAKDAYLFFMNKNDLSLWSLDLSK